ncbi:MAG: septum formation initiator family protein [Acetatifactor sp.]|nr:septum formation initiator family protein [Acetatifactor sp.]
MARTRRRVAYRRKNQNRLSMFLVSLVVLMIMVAAAWRSVELQKKIDAKTREKQQLEEQIAQEKNRSREIEEFGKKIQTKGYIEDIAREKLGLVYEGEIMFKEER